MKKNKTLKTYAKKEEADTLKTFDHEEKQNIENVCKERRS